MTRLKMVHTSVIVAFVAVLASGVYAQLPYRFVNLDPGGTAGSTALAATESTVVYGYTTQPADFFTRAAPLVW